MNPHDVIPGLLDPSPCFVCRELQDRSALARYRVPVVHRKLSNVFVDVQDDHVARRAIAGLPAHPSVEQLVSLVDDGLGIGLWASPRLVAADEVGELDVMEIQAALGSLLIFPPAEWEYVRSDMGEWLFDENGEPAVDKYFEHLPYTLDDILPFAGMNFSPDRWYLVLRGSMAGNVCWWTHDGDSVMDRPWAADLKAWASRVWTELPAVLDGMARFWARDSIDPAPAHAELVPIEYRRELPPVP